MEAKESESGVASSKIWGSYKDCTVAVVMARKHLISYLFATCKKKWKYIYLLIFAYTLNMLPEKGTFRSKGIVRMILNMYMWV